MEGKMVKETLPEGIIGIVLVYSALNILTSTLPHTFADFTIIVDIVFKPAGGLGLMIMTLITMKRRISVSKGTISWILLSLSFLAPWLGVFALIDQNQPSRLMAFIMGLSILGLVAGTDILFHFPNRLRSIAYPFTAAYALVAHYVYFDYFTGKSGIFILTFYLKQGLQLIFWGSVFYLVWKDKVFTLPIFGADKKSVINNDDLLFPKTADNELGS